MGWPYISGLASFGEEAVEAPLRILTRELVGTPSIAEITRHQAFARSCRGLIS